MQHQHQQPHHHHHHHHQHHHHQQRHQLQPRKEEQEAEQQRQRQQQQRNKNSNNTAEEEEEEEEEGGFCVFGFSVGLGCCFCCCCCFPISQRQGRCGRGLGRAGGQRGAGGLPQPFYLSSPKCHDATTTLGPGEKAESLRWIPDLDTSDASADFHAGTCYSHMQTFWVDVSPVSRIRKIRLFGLFSQATTFLCDVCVNVLGS